MSFKVFKNHPNAVVPARADPGAAGYDLTSVEDVMLPPGTFKIIDTGLVFEFPNDCYGRVAPRSGLAAKNGIDVLAGVVDSTYRGNVKVILVNHSNFTFNINSGDRIAQLIFERIYTPQLVEVEKIEELLNTERGTGGFGSTGK